MSRATTLQNHPSLASAGVRSAPSTSNSVAGPPPASPPPLEVSRSDPQHPRQPPAPLHTSTSPQPDMQTSDSDLSRWSAASASEVSYFTRMSGSVSPGAAEKDRGCSGAHDKDTSSFRDQDLVKLMERMGGPDEEIAWDDEPAGRNGGGDAQVPSQGAMLVPDTPAGDASRWSSSVATSRPTSNLSARPASSSELDMLADKVKQLVAEAGHGTLGEHGPNVVLPADVAVELVTHLDRSKTQRAEHNKLQAKYSRMRRASRMAAQGFSLARTEFESEVNARHLAEARLAALRAAGHGSVPSPVDNDDQAARQSLRAVEADLARLAAQRDLERSELAELVKANKAALRTSVTLSARNRSQGMSQQSPDTFPPLLGESKKPFPPPRRKRTRGVMPLGLGSQGLSVDTSVATTSSTSASDAPLTGVGAIGMALVQPMSGFTGPSPSIAEVKDEGVDALTAARSLPASPDVAPPELQQPAQTIPQDVDESSGDLHLAAQLEAAVKAQEEEEIEAQSALLTARLAARLDEVKASHREAMDQLVAERKGLEQDVVSLRERAAALSRDVEQLATLKDSLQEETLSLTTKNEELTDAVAQQARLVEDYSRLLDQYEAQVHHNSTLPLPLPPPPPPPPPAPMGVPAAGLSPSPGQPATLASSSAAAGRPYPPRTGLLQRLNGTGLSHSGSSGSLPTTFGFGRSPTPQQAHIPLPDVVDRAPSPAGYTIAGLGLEGASTAAPAANTAAASSNPPPVQGKKFWWGKTSRPPAPSIGPAMISAPLAAAGGASGAFGKRPGSHVHSPSVQSGGTSIGMSETSTFASRGTGQDHALVPFNVLRPARCMGCGKNMWGASETRCTACGGVCHARCKDLLPTHSCEPRKARKEPLGLGGSMFGAELSEQCALEMRQVPVVVEKCIEAVEMNGTSS